MRVKYISHTLSIPETRRSRSLCRGGCFRPSRHAFYAWLRWNEVRKGPDASNAPKPQSKKTPRTNLRVVNYNVPRNYKVLQRV
jgi:hypothetical protein